MGVIETGNAISLESLLSDYVFPDEILHQQQHFSTWLARDGKEERYSISLETSSSITVSDMRACFDLISETSAEMYKASNGHWSPAQKRWEMKLPDLRYLLVRRRPPVTSDDKGIQSVILSGKKTSLRSSTTSNSREMCTADEFPVEGYLSYMLTYEDGHEVVYCYELHLRERLQGRGVGSRLMGLMENVGRRFGVEKAMLTVFLANVDALNFYQRCGCAR